MSEDMTYCFFSECPNKKCERHESHIKLRDIPHSYAFFTNCVWWTLPTWYFSQSGKKGEENNGNDKT